jgi:hypothetical protein
LPAGSYLKVDCQLEGSALIVSQVLPELVD